MLASFLMGLLGGQRAMTPLATVAVATARGALPRDNGAPKIIAHPIVAAGALALAVAEMAGDKQKSATDRIVPIGLAARFITSAIAGAAVGGLTAVAASYPGWRIRTALMPRYGQTLTGFIEDAVVLSSAIAISRTFGNRPAA